MYRFLLVLFILHLQTTLPSQDCETSEVIQRSIAAEDTDSAFATELHESQVFINSSCTSNNKLLLHLVGTIDNPANTTYFPTLAANAGYKVINLKYNNNVATKDACSESPDEECFRNYRQEIVFGTPVSPEVNVDSTESIVNRLVKLLVYLHDLYPSEGWSDFYLESQTINWSNIVLSGHSQGGGHAAYLAKLYDVDRVLMFSSPNDFSEFFDQPAEWLNDESMTKEYNYFAFGNKLDDVVDFDFQLQNWVAMGFSEQNDSMRVDGRECGYENSRILYTEYDSSGLFKPNHSAVIIDRFTPVASGVPVYEEVWKYMLGLCEMSSSLNPEIKIYSHLSIHPNPFSSIFQVESQDVIGEIAIYDQLGQLVFTSKPLKKSFQVQFSSRPGLFYLHIRTQHSQDAVLKIIKL